MINKQMLNSTAQPPMLSRIAPTPSGYLHAGNAFSFVLSWLLIRKTGGKLLLRIDDSDTTRSRPEYIEDIFYTLEWLGLDYDLGPSGPDDFARNFSQKHRFGLYQSVLEDLKTVTSLVYACNCSRKQIREISSDGLYPGSCRERGLKFHQKNCAWRIKVPDWKEVSFKELLSNSKELHPIGKKMGDFIVRRKDGLPAYQLVSLADDIHFGVNMVVRGKDLRDSTAAQLYLANCLAGHSGSYTEAAKTFQQAQFLHHPLLRNNKGEKLSKSKGASSILQMREAGKGPQEIYKTVALFAGISDEHTHNMGDLLHAFNLPALQQTYQK